MLADAEIVAITHETLRALGFDKYRIGINHRKILSAFIDAAGVPPRVKYPAIRAIDKRDKIGREGVTRELVKLEVEKGVIDSIINILFERYARGDFDYYMEAAARTVNEIDEGREGIAEMKRLHEYLLSFGIPTRVMSFDLHMARGLDYYTGPIFETTVPEAGVGSVTGGGRYDHLILLLGGPDLPATGTTVGLERIIAIMEERGGGVTPSGYADVMVALYKDDMVAEAARLANELRAAGLACELYLEPKAKLAKQFSYADAKGIPFVVVVGPDELAHGTAAVKDLRAREQKQVPRERLLTYLRGKLAENEKES